MRKKAHRQSGWFPIVRVIAACTLILTAVIAQASPEIIKSATDRIEQIRAELDRAEATIERAQGQSKALAQLRGEVDELVAEVNEIVETLEPLHAAAEARVKELGPQPSADKPPEAISVASEREQQSLLLRDTDAALKQARLLRVRGGQIITTIDDQRRTAFTYRLFERGESFFSPALWIRGAEAIGPELTALAKLASAWRAHIADEVGATNLALGLGLSLAAVLAIFIASAWIRRRMLTPLPAREGEAAHLPRSYAALIAIRNAILNALTAPAASIAVLELLTAFGLLPGELRSLAMSLVSAIVLFAVGNALALAVLSPGEPRLRLPALDDDAARTLYRLVAGAVAVTALALFVNALHRTLTTSVPLTIATSALYAFLIGLLIAITLVSGRTRTADQPGGGLPPWIRMSGWLVASVIFVALAAGYIRFAALVAERVVTAAIVLIALVLLLALVDALLGEGLERDSPRRRNLAATLGMQPRTLDLIAALVAGVLRALLVLAAIFLVVGTLTASAFNIESMLDRATFAVQIGQLRIGLFDVITAAAVLLIGAFLTRVIYRWLAGQILPRTRLEPSLQNSIATIIGYVGIIAAIALALARLGVNLENIALVAGALSIGIGFGLQAIVSNFVSGLILLTERPIRVGDWIVVGQEQGYVRKISVRSTEIETFDRASVIVPNSDLITGTVKNWTHFNNLGRFEVPVRISYDADPHAVRELLLKIAADHPLVLDDPSPNVFFLAFGDSSLNLDLRGFVADVNQAFGVRSELHFEIFRRFREAGIEIPFPQRDIHIRSAPANAVAGDQEEQQEEGEESGETGSRRGRSRKRS